MTNPSFVPFAFLPIYKPTGPTSHDIVDRVRQWVPKGVKVGHTGTLDPFASGVLVLGLGKANRFVEEVHKHPKSYQAEIRLGSETDTLDPTGTIIAEAAIPEFSSETLDRIAADMTGCLDQVPPKYSAKRIKGRKAYELARRNQEVILPPKRVTIHHMALRKIDGQTLHCEVSCSTGTYVRALARDIAVALGTRGHLISLERTRVGPVTVAHCHQLDQLSTEHLGNCLLPVSELVPNYPEVQLPRSAYTYFADGRPFRTHESLPKSFLAVFERNDGSTAAIFRCEFHPDRELVQPRQVCYLSPELR